VKRWIMVLSVIGVSALGIGGTAPGAAAGEGHGSPAIGGARQALGDLAQAPPATQFNQAGAEGGSAGNGSVELPKALQGLKIGGVAYIAYAAGKKGGKTYNEFELKRGYFDVQKTLTPYLMGRYTTDITQLSSGDWETRIKYLYGKLTFEGTSFITQPGVEFGQAHVPYHDFWEAINGYRVQGTMFLERNGIFNSADRGVIFGCNFGGEMDATYKKEVNGHYAGRYGSTQIGVYDGGGYHGREVNENKVVKGRVTVRPVPDQVPGLQVSVLGIDGKANVAQGTYSKIPDWRGADVMLSYQSRNLTATGEAYAGKGNQSGSAVDASGRSLDQNGYSFFAAVKIPQHEAWGVMGRYDHFDGDIHSSTNDEPDRFIGGVSYTMKGGNMWLVDFEHLKHSVSGMSDENRGELALQLSY
jgi:hypothetical protein